MCLIAIQRGHTEYDTWHCEAVLSNYWRIPFFAKDFVFTLLCVYMQWY